MDNSYFTPCELQAQSLQKFASDLLFLSRDAMTPGEPYRFNWVTGAIRQRANALQSMLAKEPENPTIRDMLRDYRQLENEAWSVVMQPPYAKAENVVVEPIKIKVAFLHLYIIGVTFSSALALFC